MNVRNIKNSWLLNINQLNIGYRMMKYCNQYIPLYKRLVKQFYAKGQKHDAEDDTNGSTFELFRHNAGADLAAGDRKQCCKQNKFPVDSTHRSMGNEPGKRRKTHDKY